MIVIWDYPILLECKEDDHVFEYSFLTIDDVSKEKIKFHSVLQFMRGRFGELGQFQKKAFEQL